MSRFVRQSSYRHTFGTPKKEKYENIKISGQSASFSSVGSSSLIPEYCATASAWDTNLVAVSEKYIAVNCKSSLPSPSPRRGSPLHEGPR